MGGNEGQDHELFWFSMFFGGLDRGLDRSDRTLAWVRHFNTTLTIVLQTFLR